MPDTSTTSPASKWEPFTLSTKTPPVASWTKNLPFNAGSEAVTTPVTNTLRDNEALSAGSEMTSTALVSNAAGGWALTGAAAIKQPAKIKCAKAAQRRFQRRVWRQVELALNGILKV